MSDPSLTDVDALPLPLARQCEQRCRQFEDAWQAGVAGGARPPPGGHPARGAGPARAWLLRELLLLEVHYRRRLGEAPQPQDYQERFPGHEDLIDGVFQRLFPAQPSRSFPSTVSDVFATATGANGPAAAAVP